MKLCVGEIMGGKAHKMINHTVRVVLTVLVPRCLLSRFWSCAGSRPIVWSDNNDVRIVCLSSVQRPGAVTYWFSLPVCKGSRKFPWKWFCMKTRYGHNRVFKKLAGFKENLNQVPSISLTSLKALPNKRLFEADSVTFLILRSHWHSQKLSRNQVAVRWKAKTLSEL